MNQHSHSCPIKYSTESPNGANDISVAEERIDHPEIAMINWRWYPCTTDHLMNRRHKFTKPASIIRRHFLQVLRFSCSV